jgi:hypothetical protein
VAAVRAVTIIEAVARVARVIVVDRTTITVKAVKVAVADRLIARVVRVEDKAARITARVVRVEGKAARVTARVVRVEGKAARVMLRAEDKVRVVVVPTKATLTSIGTKISIVMAMVAARDEAISPAICSNILNRLLLRCQPHYHNSSLGYDPSLNQKTETTAT